MEPKVITEIFCLGDRVRVRVMFRVGVRVAIRVNVTVNSFRDFFSILLCAQQ